MDSGDIPLREMRVVGKAEKLLGFLLRVPLCPLKNLAQTIVGVGKRKHYLIHLSSQINLVLCQQRSLW